MKEADREISDAFKAIAHTANILSSTPGKRRQDQLFSALQKAFTFQEIPAAGLGLSKKSTKGAGVGKVTALDMAAGARDLSRSTDNWKAMLLIGLIQKGLGPDRISDMTLFLAKQSFSAYTQRVIKKIGRGDILTSHRISNPATGREELIVLPYNHKTGSVFFLIPNDVLSKIPLAVSAGDISQVVSANTNLRNYVNERFIKSARAASIGKSSFVEEGVSKSPKDVLREELSSTPELVTILADAVFSSQEGRYDVESDPENLLGWEELGTRMGKAMHLKNSVKNSSMKTAPLVDCVDQIISEFKDLIENCDGWDLLYDQTSARKPLKEKTAQRAFYVAVKYMAKSFNLDLSREVHNGGGPVDFKFSRGASNVLVEMKMSSNKKLDDGLVCQLPAYMAANSSAAGRYLVIDTSQNKSNADLSKMISRLQKMAPRGIKVIGVNGAMQISASKRGGKAVSSLSRQAYKQSTNKNQLINSPKSTVVSSTVSRAKKIP